MSLETKCLLKAFWLHYCPENDAKSIVKHLIFLQKFAVVKTIFKQNFSQLKKKKEIWKFDSRSQRFRILQKKLQVLSFQTVQIGIFQYINSVFKSNVISNGLAVRNVISNGLAVRIKFNDEVNHLSGRDSNLLYLTKKLRLPTKFI